MNFDYDFPEDWDTYTQPQKQDWFDEMRQRWMWFLFKDAEYTKERTERVKRLGSSPVTAGSLCLPQPVDSTLT